MFQMLWRGQLHLISDIQEESMTQIIFKDDKQFPLYCGDCPKCEKYIAPGHGLSHTGGKCPHCKNNFKIDMKAIDKPKRIKLKHATINPNDPGPYTKGGIIPTAQQNLIPEGENPKPVWVNKSLNKQEGGTYYKSMKIQPIEYIVANHLGFTEGNIVKYISRHREKNGLEDLRKAKHMLELLAELEYGEEL